MQSIEPACELVPWGSKAARAKNVFDNLPQKRRLAVIGSTGSIGLSTLEVVRKFPESFEIHALAGFGSKPQQLLEQIQEFKPKRVALFSQQSALQLAEMLEINSALKPKLEAGESAICDICCDPQVDVVLAAVVGVAGLPSVLAALKAGKIVALANKESLVVAGKLITEFAKQKTEAGHNLIILPVDSEHAAIFQALQGVNPEEVSSLTLTASGGPFLRKSLDQLKDVSVQQAISHPRWKMGAKISVDSATLINKGLELIEAHYLFGLPASKLNAVIHPQSIVHGIVNLTDGSSLLQASYPDMQEPIAQALNFPKSRLAGITKALDLPVIAKLEFEQIDHQRFPAVNLALQSIEKGAESCLIYNQANETAVSAFLSGKISFSSIVPFVQEMLELDIVGSFADFSTLNEYLDLVSNNCLEKISKFKE